MKILKTIGALIVLAGVFAIGYWRGQSDPKADHESAASGHSAGQTAGGSRMNGWPRYGFGRSESKPRKTTIDGHTNGNCEIRPMFRTIRTDLGGCRSYAHQLLSFGAYVHSGRPHIVASH